MGYILCHTAKTHALVGDWVGKVRSFLRDMNEKNGKICVRTQIVFVRTQIRSHANVLRSNENICVWPQNILCLLPLMLHVIMATQREDIINVYLGMGLKYCDIVRIIRVIALAIYHDIIISEKHVKRILKSMGLYRRKNYSDITDVIDFIKQQLKESGKQHLFYRGHR